MKRRIAVTGHRGLTKRTMELVDGALRAKLSEYAVGSSLIGFSCLADGADSIFAQALLDHGGSLTAVVPARSYRDELPSEHHPVYDELFRQASSAIHLDRDESDSQAHMDASVQMLDGADELIAVWDGNPARGYGGTADVVDAARKREIKVTTIWPDGASRD